MDMEMAVRGFRLRSQMFATSSSSPIFGNGLKFSCSVVRSHGQESHAPPLPANSFLHGFLLETRAVG